MERIRLTMAQALVRFLDNQYVELDGVENKFVNGIFGVFGHGCAVFRKKATYDTTWDTERT